VGETAVLERIWRDKSPQNYWLEREQNNIFVSAARRGNLKQALIQVGYPVKDLCGYVTGKTKHAERETLYAAFRAGDIKIIVVSKVANFAVDLPDANVMIQVSGTYGSRQEEAQRLGRILRPKEQASHFYTFVSGGTREQEFGVKRQMFLVEQGYRYEIRYFEEETP
jgi:DNA excision repair protein ERCC-3